MILSLGITGEHRISFYAGILTSVFTFCEFLSGMVWGKIADCIGRRWTLMIGILCGVFSAILFSLSKSLAVAIVARGMGGLLNPNSGVVNVCISELVPGRQQCRRSLRIDQVKGPLTFWSGSFLARYVYPRAGVSCFSLDAVTTLEEVTDAQ